jgi:hypothetical protein
MTLGDAAEPHAHINDFRMDFGDSFLMLRPSSTCSDMASLSTTASSPSPGRSVSKKLTAR